jgi:hypothetical protein
VVGSILYIIRLWEATVSLSSRLITLTVLEVNTDFLMILLSLLLISLMIWPFYETGEMTAKLLKYTIKLIKFIVFN